MSFAQHRVSNAWRNYTADPCAKTMLALSRVLSKHQYDPQWPCHAWVRSQAWQSSPWRIAWHSALVSSFRTSAFSAIAQENAMLDRMCRVARWVEHRESLKNIVSADAWCPLEWWILGGWLDQLDQSTETFVDFVADWDPVWALAAPAYRPLGWRKGLQALHQQMIHQGSSNFESIDASTCWSLDCV